MTFTLEPSPHALNRKWEDICPYRTMTIFRVATVPPASSLKK